MRCRGAPPITTAAVLPKLISLILRGSGTSRNRARDCRGVTPQGGKLLIMLMTNDRAIMGGQVNRPALNVLGWATTAAIFAASIGLVVTSLA
jgi:Mn2+/Fe2+ NRAMP family transporter